MPLRLEVERTWAWAQRPGLNFWLAINKLQAPSLTYLMIIKAQSWLDLRFYYFKKIGLKPDSKEIFAGSVSYKLDKQRLNLPEAQKTGLVTTPTEMRK